MPMNGIRGERDLIATIACQRAMEHIRNMLNLSSLELELVFPLSMSLRTFVALADEFVS